MKQVVLKSGPQQTCMSLQLQHLQEEAEQALPAPASCLKLPKGAESVITNVYNTHKARHSFL